jgi:hypothetical protein
MGHTIDIRSRSERENNDPLSRYGYHREGHIAWLTSRDNGENGN